MPEPEEDRPERIGLFGGTFDPPHAGHVSAAQQCRTALGLDRVLLVVANSPWQKTGQREITPAEDRWELVLAAAEGLAGIDPCRIELDRGGPSYTIETVEELDRLARASGEPEPEVFLVIGSDLVETLPTWHRFGDLAARVVLVVVGRPGSENPPDPDGWRVERVAGERVDVSSSQLRATFASGGTVGDEVPSAVVRQITLRGLYAVRR